jgi:hypothetical protein
MLRGLAVSSISIAGSVGSSVHTGSGAAVQLIVLSPFDTE